MGIEQIEHVVVLMLENRSFDGMLGWLYEDANDPPGLSSDLTVRTEVCRVSISATDTPDDSKPPTMSGVLSDFVSVLQGFGYSDDEVRAIAPMA